VFFQVQVLATHRAHLSAKIGSMDATDKPRQARARHVPQVPSWEHELELCSEQYKLLAGVDEAGRGAWAGPLVAGAAIFPHPDTLMSTPEAAGLLKELSRLRDSKMLAASVREELLPAIEAVATSEGRSGRKAATKRNPAALMTRKNAARCRVYFARA